MNPLVELNACGQSFWYDNIRRKYLRDGTVKRLIADDGLRGMTSNPAIFQKAIGAGDEYDRQIETLINDGWDVKEIYEALALSDIRAACDLFSAIYEESDGADGFVSLEVSPHLARDTQGTLDEARRLFKAVNRPNVMIKVPATKEGIPAIQQLLSEGININITLMFSMSHYEAVAQAYINGLVDLTGRGGDPSRVASVASFFVSRVDTAVDRQLASMEDPASPTLIGKTAIANSKIVYERYKEIFHGPSFKELRAAGAKVQRLLWASTSTKNPSYPDTLYVDELIGPETVNTIPPQTVDAFRDHGRVGHTLESGLDDAYKILASVQNLGVDLKSVTEQLQQEGVVSFSRSFDGLLQTLEEKVEQISAEG